MLTLQEKEVIMGYPMDYTNQAASKASRSQDPQKFEDLRHSLIGNSWHVGVVSSLLQPLVVSQGLAEDSSLEQLCKALQPGESSSLAGKLLRPSFRKATPFRKLPRDTANELQLVRNLSHLVSPKGTDILLTDATDVIPKNHRLRNSLNPNLWQWQIICGWKWKRGEGHCSEHINKLEMRAIYTSVKWRLFKQRVAGKRCVHLVDSLVSLQLLNKGRTSSRKLRRVSQKIASLLIAGNLLLILAYTNTKTNPADAPSRRSTKRKWSAVK